MSCRRSVIFSIALLLFFTVIAGCGDDAPSGVVKRKDQGVIIYRVGVDTVGYQYFRIDGDSIELRVIDLPGGFSYTRSTGELEYDGSIKTLHSIRMINDSTGSLVLDGQTRINSSGAVTSVDVTGTAATEYIFPGTAYAISNAGPVTSYMLPFWPSYAKDKDSVTGIQYAFQGPRHFWMMKVTDNLVYAGSDLTGKFKMRVDSMKRLLSVDGMETTLHVKGDVNRSMDFDSLLDAVHSNPALQSLPALSPVSKNFYRFPDLDVMLNYSRPSKRGRKIFGGIVSYEKPWRLGANRCTEISFSEPVYFNQRKVDPGTYSLFAMMYPDAAMLLINDHEAIWGTDHEFQWDAFRIPMHVEHLAVPREQLELRVDAIGDGMYELIMEWDDVRATVDFAMVSSGTSDD